MTVSAVFRVDTLGASWDRYILENFTSNTGYVLYVDDTSDRLKFQVRHSFGTNYTIQTAPLTAGTTYVATASFDGSDLRLVLDQTTTTTVAAAMTPSTGVAGMGANNSGGANAYGITLLGVAYSDSTALTDSEMQTHNALCKRVGGIRPFTGAENMWDARFGLHTDLIGNVHLTPAGTTYREDFVYGKAHALQSWGDSGFSGSNYYSGAILDGASNMTRSIMFEYDGTNSITLAQKDDANDGWQFYISSGGGVVARLRSGGTSYQRGSAALTSGNTYVATFSFDGTSLRIVVNQATHLSLAASFTASSVDATLGTDNGGASATGSTIIGFAASDTNALTDAEMQEHNGQCTSLGRMVAFDGCEHLYDAREGMQYDLIGSADWTLNGSLTREHFVPYIV